MNIQSHIAVSFFLVIHISAHVFNFENLVEAYDGTDLQHRLSIMKDTGNKTYINPVRKQNSVSTLIYSTVPRS